jgi:phosphate transport system protein
MARLMDMGLDKLKNLVMDMARLSEESVTRAMELYVEGTKPSGDVFDQSEKLRILEEEVSELSVELIARYQPVASDLRFIKSCMEISYGFSRFGRYAYDITEVLMMFGDITSCDKTDVEKAGGQAKSMIRTSITAFAERDANLARKLSEMDDVVDDIYRAYIRKVTKDSKMDVKCSVSATLVLRYLERIADHAKYIGDSVLYILTAEPSPRL